IGTGAVSMPQGHGTQFGTIHQCIGHAVKNRQQGRLEFITPRVKGYGGRDIDLERTSGHFHNVDTQTLGTGSLYVALDTLPVVAGNTTHRGTNTGTNGSGATAVTNERAQPGTSQRTGTSTHGRTLSG